jgi:hypothetical protein
MTRMINKVMSMISLHHFGDVVREFVDIFSIWQGRFSLTILKIESICKLEDFEFIDIPG